MRLPLTENLMQRLREEATRRVVGPVDCARQSIEKRLDASQTKGSNEAVLELLDQWDREDQTDDPAEIGKRQRDFEQFKEAINASHSSNRKIYL